MFITTASKQEELSTHYLTTQAYTRSESLSVSSSVFQGCVLSHVLCCLLCICTFGCRPDHNSVEYCWGVIAKRHTMRDPISQHYLYVCMLVSMLFCTCACM